MRKLSTVRWRDDISQDIRFALRVARSSPLVTAVIILTIALGIGANTAIFSVVDAVLLRPLPFPRDHELVSLWATNPDKSIPRFGVSYADFRDWEARTKSFRGMALYSSSLTSLNGPDGPESVASLAVTPNFLGVLGVTPEIGRFFDANADRDAPGMSHGIRPTPARHVVSFGARATTAIDNLETTSVTLGFQLQSTKAMLAKAGFLALIVLPLAPPPPRPLYLPRAIASAYRNGTRSITGRPGARYWQNRGHYAMTVTALPPNRTVTGREQINYHNNSPDTLRNLGFKLFMNIHRPGAPRENGANDAYLTSGVHVDSFAVNGKAQRWNDDPRLFTTRRVDLPVPLVPHDSVRLALNWHYDVSREAGREGMLDSTTYFLAYFYPRVAVYDDYNGWDDMTFTDDQEFYSDFNDYDVTIRAPANFVVYGTGTLRNPEEVLQPEVARRFQSSFTSDSVIRIAGPKDFAAKRVTLAGAMNSWHFTASDIPDMTFALSDHYDWDAASVVVNDADHRRASVQAAYNDTAADFHHMVQFGRRSLDWLSHNWPGVPYPYEKSTIVQGSADMEYPMMVNDGSNADTTVSRFIAEHEIAHTYFPFYMGINETRYGFMDEGWATTFEYLIGIADMSKPRADSAYENFRVTAWIGDPSPVEDLPIITPADMLNHPAYGHNAYGKASLGYLAVKDLLGDALFKKSLQAFMDRWHGKHPIPWDFFNTMNDASGRNLNWFWNNWYFSNGYIDIALKSVATSAGGYSIVLDNVGGMAAPVNLRVEYSDGSADSVHETPAIWAANQARSTVRLATRKTLASVRLEHGIWMDADTTNDVWRAGASPRTR